MAAGQLLIGLGSTSMPWRLSLTLCSLGIIGSSILVAPRWGLTGIALCMAGSKAVTYWPIQLHVSPAHFPFVADPNRANDRTAHN